MSQRVLLDPELQLGGDRSEIYTHDVRVRVLVDSTHALSIKKDYYLCSFFTEKQQTVKTCLPAIRQTFAG